FSSLSLIKIRRPPISTPFPYTTLFRSGNVYGSGDKETLGLPAEQIRLLDQILALDKPVILVVAAGSAISLYGREEHPNLHAILQDRKSTRLNSSHVSISYAVFCLKKKH